EEIAELSKQHKILVVTGGGVRVRHIMDIGIDLGMPTGVLAELASKISEQNAVMVSLLLSRWGGSRVKTSDHADDDGQRHGRLTCPSAAVERSRLLPTASETC